MAGLIYSKEVYIVHFIVFQITISGQLVISNRLSQHLEVKLASEKSGGKDHAPAAVPAFEAMPSYVMEHNISRAIKVCQPFTKGQYTCYWLLNSRHCDDAMNFVLDI